ncbi:hypothetical protein BJ165DRAFT_1493765 [Panaeolus papilionaceus]|nr:hypothetical protein BJ165DRAFT_1493765 [Panaeolus papilionaceus]
MSLSLWFFSLSLVLMPCGHVWLRRLVVTCFDYHSLAPKNSSALAISEPFFPHSSLIDSGKRHKTNSGPTGIPIPSTIEDPTTTSHFAENEFLNVSKAKSRRGGSETEAVVGVVEGPGGDKEREVVRVEEVL